MSVSKEQNMLHRVIVLLIFLSVGSDVFAQTCPSNVPVSTPTSRFTDNGNGTVSDTATGLMWKRCIEGMTWNNNTCTGSESDLTWQSALQQAVTVNGAGGYVGKTDWRVPNQKELRSIIERQCYSPAINLNIFPNTPSSSFWSSSPGAGDSSYAWYVFFDVGYGGWGDRSNTYAVRLVRVGQ